MAVITISRMSGSGGDEIARKLARAFNFRLFNETMVENTAREEGLSAHEMLRVADHYQVENFIERLIRGDYYKLWDEDRLPSLTDKQVQIMFEKAAHEAMQNSNVIIVGRGGQAMLQGQANVLHVRIVAPIEMRIKKIQDDYALDNEQALDLIKNRERASAEYLKHVFDADLGDPTLYHLILNTGKLEQEASLRLITEAAHVILPEFVK